MLAMRRLIGTAAAPASILAAVISFVTDVLQPLGNFAPWVAGLSLLTAVVSGAAYWRFWRKPGADRFEHPLLGVFILSLAFAVFFGGWSWVEANGPQRGYLASNVDPIAQVQAQLLGLQADVTKIKETTQRSATVVAQSATAQAQGQDTTQKTATQVAVASTAQAQGFKEIQDAFARLSGSGTLVPNPQTPQEWYANARLYQLKGDTANAIKAYEGYFTFNLEYVDPYNEYIALLKASEGIARTRQLIADRYAARKDSQTLDLVSARLLDAQSERLQRLTALAARAPQYGPVFLELGQEYDRALAQSPTADLAKKQSDAYTALLKLEDQQGLSRFYIDKVIADRDLTTARKMLDAYATYGKTVGKIDILFYFYATEIQVILVLPEAGTAQKVLVSFDDPQPKTDLGKQTIGDKSVVNTFIRGVRLPVGEHTIYVQYVDANGVSSPILSKKFRVDPIAINAQQQPPDFSTGTISVVFTLGVLDTPPETFYTFKYSVDAKTLDNTLSGVAMTVLTVPGLKPGDHVLYVQGTAQDGKQTPIVEYPFPVK